MFNFIWTHLHIAEQMLSIVPPISYLLEGKKQNGVSGVFLASGNESLDRGEPQKSLKMMLETGRKRGLVSVHHSTIFIWAITLQIEPSPSTGTKWGLLVINTAVWKQRDVIKKKRNQRLWLAWPSSRPVCWNQIREWGLAGWDVWPLGSLRWRISLPPAPIADWFHLQMGKIKMF